MPQRLSNVPLAELVPETQHWNQGTGIDLRAWAAYAGNIELAIAMGELFWPEFVEFDDCVFRDYSHKQPDWGWYEKTLRSLDGNRRSVEALRNHVHIWDVFVRKAGESAPTRDQCLYLARLLREMWEAKLLFEFPARHVQVVVNENDPEGDFQVTFFQQRDEAKENESA